MSEASTPISKDKRLHLTAATVAAVILGRKFGVELSDAELTLIGTLVVGYIGQSQLGRVKAIQAMGKAAAAKVKTTQDADAVIE
jgi:hypothetical protein